MVRTDLSFLPRLSLRPHKHERQFAGCDGWDGKIVVGVYLLGRYTPSAVPATFRHSTAFLHSEWRAGSSFTAPVQRGPSEAARCASKKDGPPARSPSSRGCEEWRIRRRHGKDGETQQLHRLLRRTSVAYSVSGEGGPPTARIGRAPFHRARSASKEGAWAAPLSFLAGV